MASYKLSAVSKRRALLLTTLQMAEKLTESSKNEYFTPLWPSASSHVDCRYPFLAVAAASLASQGTVSLCFLVTVARSSDHDDFCPLFCNLLACKLLKEHNSCQKWLISDRSFRKCEQNRIKSSNAIASKHQVSLLRNNVNRDPGIALRVNMSSCDWLTS